MQAPQDNAPKQDWVSYWKWLAEDAPITEFGGEMPAVCIVNTPTRMSAEAGGDLARAIWSERAYRARAQFEPKGQTHG